MRTSRPSTLLIGLGSLLISTLLTSWTAHAAPAIQLPASCDHLIPKNLQNCLLGIIGELHKNGERTGDQSWIYQMVNDGKCDTWVKRARPYLEQLRSAETDHFFFYDALMSWSGPGGLHNLYFGVAVHDPRSLIRIFVFDPWKADLHQRFYWVTDWKPMGAPLMATIGDVTLGWDPIMRMLYLPKGLHLNDFTVEPNSTGYEEIEVPTVKGSHLYRPPFVNRMRLGSPIRF